VSSPLLAQIRVGFHPSGAAANESGATKPGNETAVDEGTAHSEAGELRVVLDLASAAVVASPPARDGRSVRVRLTRVDPRPAAGPATLPAAASPRSDSPAAAQPTTPTANASPSIASQ
jgi:hypothetical protein